MTHRPTTTPGTKALAAWLALLAHLPVLLLLVAMLTPEGWPGRNETEEDQEKAEKKEEDDEIETIPVVSLDRPEDADKNQEAPDKPSALDRFNQKVEKETVRARKSGTPGGRAKPQEVVADRKTKLAKRANPKPDKKRHKSKGEAIVAPAKTKPSETPAKSDKGKDDAALDNETESAETEDDGQADIKFDPSKILPNLNNTTPGDGGEGPRDYLEIEEGEKDLINRARFRYWGFFDRTTESVRRQWKPKVVYRRYDPRGQVYGVGHFQTVLRVVLNGDGSIKNLTIKKPSGVPPLDDEAIRAMRAAQPYPRPPEGLKDEDGVIRFTFVFAFDVHKGGSRIFRFR